MMHSAPTSVGAAMNKYYMASAVLAVCGFLATSAAHAQGNTAGIPANFPPDTFKGGQYVDNKGCVYIRAGFDGNTTWVPRVARNRKPVCGQTPTFGGKPAAPATTVAQAPAAKPAVKSAPKPVQRQPVSEPVQITLPTPQPKAVPQPAPVVVAQPKPVIKPVSVPRPVPNPAPITRTAASAPVPVTTLRRPQASVPQPVYQGTHRQVVVERSAKVVTRPAPRTLPQVAPAGDGFYRGCSVAHDAGCRTAPAARTHTPVDLNVAAAQIIHPVRTGTSSQIIGLPGNTWIVPKAVYERNKQAEGLSIPKGYRKAWDDDRLNPYRAYQTVDGYNQMHQVWTNTLPRRSIYAKVPITDHFAANIRDED